MPTTRAARLAALSLLAAAAAALAQPAPAAPRPAAPAPAPTVSARIAAILDQAQASNDAAPAFIDLTLLLDSLIASTPGSPSRDLAPWREVAAARRMAAHLDALPPETRKDLLPFLRRSPALASTLAFLVRPEDDVKAVYTLLDRLRRERGEHLERYATLAAAVCVVHDTPLVHTINENTATAADPVAIFDFFRTTERNLLFGLREVPAELLVYVVDSSASIEEMAWAQARYKGDRQVGRRFFDVKYDEEHFYKDTPKKLTLAGFNLRNMLKVGGICADQAYFAGHVGKSIGVPTAYVVGQDASGAHAWIGYLQSSGRAVEWNFDSGRYDSYQVVRGTLRDPQTRTRIPDSYLGVLAESMTAPTAVRHGALALVDAANRIGQLRDTDGPLARPADGPAPVRAPSAAAQLEFLEAALRASPGCAPGWFALRDLAAAGDLPLPELKRWSGVLFQLCGKSYPEFSLAILKPMIAAVPDVRDQNTLWSSTFKTYASRADLAAEIRFAQGSMWEAAGDNARAWDCYRDVVARYPNTSAAAVRAVARCRGLLKRAGKESAAIPFLADAWKSTKKPTITGPTFLLQSNWYNIGRVYADELEDAGRTRDADKVREQLGMSPR